MEFQPANPSHNDNIKPIKPWREFSTLLMGLIGIGVIIYILLGLSVNFVVSQIPPALEMKIFNKVYLIWEDNISENTQSEKIQTLTTGLARTMGIDQEIMAHIVESSNINAMAVPGGHIIILTGLLKEIETENGLAFILAHELGHFKNRDHLHGMGRALIITATAALLTGAESNITKMLMPASNLGLARYSQQREKMADELALITLQKHYGHIGGAPEFFTKIMNMTQQSKSLPDLYASHPEMKERINNLQEIGERHGFTTKETIKWHEKISYETSN